MIFDICSGKGVKANGKGIGDAICVMYACAGAAAQGHTIRFHTHRAEWLSRLSYPGVELVLWNSDEGFDINANYLEQLKGRPDRKQWYCDTLAREMGIEPFLPVNPNANTAIKEKRIDLEDYVLLAPFSNWPSRNWPKEHWQKLATLLKGAGHEVYAIHSDDWPLQTYFKELGIPHGSGQSAEWVQDVILGASAIIANDSGFAHLGGALGIKTIAVHTHMMPYQLFSYTDVLSAQSKSFDCIGCNFQPEHGFMAKCSFKCAALEDITPEQVVELLCH